MIRERVITVHMFDVTIHVPYKRGMQHCKKSWLYWVGPNNIVLFVLHNSMSIFLLPFHTYVVYCVRPIGSSQLKPNRRSRVALCEHTFSVMCRVVLFIVQQVSFSHPLTDPDTWGVSIWPRVILIGYNTDWHGHGGRGGPTHANNDQND